MPHRLVHSTFAYQVRRANCCVMNVKRGLGRCELLVYSTKFISSSFLVFTFNAFARWRHVFDKL